MSNVNKLVVNVASQRLETSNGDVWFTNLELKSANSQLYLDKFISKLCNFSIVGGSITGTYQFLPGSCGLVDMPNEFQRVLNSTIPNSFLPTFILSIF